MDKKAYENAIEEQLRLLKLYVKKCTSITIDYIIASKKIIFGNSDSLDIFDYYIKDEYYGVVGYDEGILTIRFRIIREYDSSLADIKVDNEGNLNILFSYNDDDYATPINLDKATRKKVIKFIHFMRKQLAEHLREIDTEKNRPEGYYEEQAAKLVIKDFIG